MCLTKNKRNFDGLSTIVVYDKVLDPTRNTVVVYCLAT